MLDAEAAACDISRHAAMYHHSLVLGWMARCTPVLYAAIAAAYRVHSRLDREVI